MFLKHAHIVFFNSNLNISLKIYLSPGVQCLKDYLKLTIKLKYLNCHFKLYINAVLKLGLIWYIDNCCA